MRVARGRWSLVQRVGDIRAGPQGRRARAICPAGRPIEFEVSELIIEITIENDYVPSSVRGFQPPESERKSVQKIETKTHRGHEPGLYVLVAPANRGARRANSFLTSEDGMAEEPTSMTEDRNIVPECQHCDPQPSIGKPVVKCLDLRAFPCAVDAGKTHDDWTAIRGHC